MVTVHYSDGLIFMCPVYYLPHICVWFLGNSKYLRGRTNELVANPLGLGQTSALQMRLSIMFNQLVYYNALKGKLFHMSRGEHLFDGKIKAGVS